MKKYYMIIPADDIYIKTNKKGLTIVGDISARDIFLKHGVPERYQKIVLKILLEEKDITAFELVTGSVYQGRETLINVLLNPKKEVYLDSLDTLIKTLGKLSTGDEVKDFFLEIIDDELAGHYSASIKEIYRYQTQANENEELRKIKRNEYIH